MEQFFKLAIIIQAFDKATRPLREITEATKKLGTAVSEAQNRFKKLGEGFKKLEDFGTSLENIGKAAAWSGAFYTITKSFTELEDAQTVLETAFMEKGEVVPEIIKKIDDVAKELGTDLPGTTADFYMLAARMKQLGVSSEALAGGALKAAAYLGAVLKPFGVTYEEAGEAVAKFSQALGIQEKNLIKFMDVIQRTAYMGVSLTEMKYAFSKMSSGLRILGWQGLDSAKALTPLVARLIQLGKSGEVVGTALNTLFTTFLNPKKVAEFNQELAKFGITLNWGKIKQGPAQMIAEFDKLHQAYKKGIISQAELQTILSRLTGAAGEDLSVLTTIVIGGIEDYNKVVEQMARQADLQKRVAKVTSTLSALWEAFTGTLEGFFAFVGSQLAPTFKTWAKFLNNLTDNMKNFFEHHQTLAKLVAWSIAIFAGLSAGAVGLGLAITTLVFPFKILYHSLSMFKSIKVFSFLTTPFQNLLKVIPYAFKGFKWFFSFIFDGFKNLLSFLPRIMGSFKNLFSFVVMGLRSLSLAMLSCPFGWVLAGIVALVAGGYLLYRHWDKVKTFFSAIWHKIVAGFHFLKEHWKKVLDIFTWINPITAPIKGLNTLVKFVWGINLFDAGAKIIKSLFEGMKHLAMKPVHVMKEIAQKIRNFLPFSPAKEGPLRDIHRIKLIETIAKAIKPDPLFTSFLKALNSIFTLTQLKNLHLPIKLEPVYPESPFKPKHQAILKLQAVPAFSFKFDNFLKALNSIFTLTQLKKAETPIKPELSKLVLAGGTPVNMQVNFGSITFSGKREEATQEFIEDFEKKIRLVLEKIAREKFRRAY